MEQIAETVRTEPEGELVERLRRRERDAAEALVTAYGDRVYRLALRITGNPSDAEEVVQDAFWTVTRKIDTFRGDAAFGSWLYRITANAAYQKLRRPRSERNEVPWESVGAPGDDRGPQQAPLADWSAGGEDVALQAEQSRHADGDRGCVRQCGGGVHYSRNRLTGISEISGLSEEGPERFNGDKRPQMGRLRPHPAGKQNLPFGRKMLRTGLPPRRRSGCRRLQPEIST
jgi:RNA polymerase sigma-70 factor (ECF subfamily)